MFKPFIWKGRTLVDGGMVNTLPINRVQRTPGDILVAFNVNQIDAAEIQGFLDSRAELEQEKNDSDNSLVSRIQAGLRQRQLEASASDSWIPVGADDNFASILQRSFGIMNCTIARMGIEQTKPDILVNLPYDSYHGVYGYSHAQEIATLGRQLMAQALDQYENK
jgi:NTE family protein